MAQGIPVASGFMLNTQQSLDLREVIDTYDNLQAMPMIQRYIGLLVYVMEDKQYYYLKDDLNIWVSLGEDSNIDMYTTGLGGVSIGQVVYITSANTVCPADYNNINCSNRVVGLTINTSNQNEKCYVKNKGKIINDAWKGIYSTGDVVYCGNTGGITKTPNMLLSKFIQKIGVFTSDDGELLIDITESVELE
jgi:hypothetical protein